MKKEFKFVLGTLGLSVLLGACIQQLQNSVSGDRVTYKRHSDNPAIQRFYNVQDVFASNCVQCHPNFGSWTEADFKTELTPKDGLNYVTAGDLDDSEIYQNLQGVTPGGEMPKNGPPLSPGEVQTIATWILNLQ
jgi:mono/diheme cytochrome c family protein